MAPKEKAKNLYDEFHSVLPSYNDEGQLEHESAKQCALIAVEEILSFIEDDRKGFNWKDYYKEVKQELEKL